MKSRGTDIVVNNMGGSLTPKAFPASIRDRIANLPGIDAACDLFVELMSVEAADMMIISAREWGGFTWSDVKIVSGRLPKDASERAVVLGKTAAEVLGKKVGDTLQLETEELAVVGIADAGAVVENGSIILSLSLFQKITENEGKINIIDIRVKPGMDDASISRLCAQITGLIPEARAVAAGEHIPAQPGVQSHPGDELGHLLAGHPGGHPWRHEHHADDRV